MARTSYNSYKWLIKTLEEASPDGLTLPSIQDEYRRYMHHLVSVRNKQGKETKGSITLSRTTFFHWRVQLWEQFGVQIETPRYDNYFVLANPEHLDANKTIREVIDFLCQEEERGFQTGTLVYSKRGRKPKQATSTSNVMGFVSVGDTDTSGYEENQEPEMVDMISFCMTFGEAMVINFSKTEAGTSHRDEKFVLEPQQLKLINGRWYVGAYLYEYGETDPHKVKVIYDVERIRLCEDDDIISPHYKVNQDFDISDMIPDDWYDHFDPDKVVSLYLKTRYGLFKDHPFCQAQMSMDNINAGMMYSVYKVYLKPDKEFCLQYLAYGDEMRVYAPYPKVERTDTDIKDDQIKYLKNLRKKLT